MLKRKFLMKIMATTVALTIATAPVAAYADDEDARGRDTAEVEVYAFEGDNKKDLGDVVAEPGVDVAVDIEAYDGYKAEATADSIESKDWIGTYMFAKDGGQTELTVEGDVNSVAEAVWTEAYQNGRSEVDIKGDVSSESMGLAAVSGGYYDVDDKKYYYSPTENPDNSSIQINVEGNVSSATENSVLVRAINGASADITVKGDVAGSTDPGEFGDYPAIYVVSSSSGSPGSSVDVRVGGDVRSADSGVCLYAHEGSQANIVIEGTLSAKEAAVIDYSRGESSVTVWKIETPGYTAAQWDDEKGSFVEDEETEKKIQYLIRVNQNDNATLTATDANGNALATVTGVNGNALEYAYEGDKVLLKIDIEDGYSLDAAYGDEGQKLELTKDAAGNYYLVVPRNGGVSFSVKLSKNKKDDDKDDDKKNDNNQGAGSYVLSDSAAVSLISSASSGSSVTLSGLSGTGLSASVVSQLLARRDIDVTVTFMLNGVFYKIVIPAGADIAGLVGADGSISFEALGQAFGIALV